MSHPSQGNSVKLYSDKPLFESEDEMRKYGWTVLNGKPYGDVVMCQKEKCMAWVSANYYCSVANECDDADGPCCDLDTCVHSTKRVAEEGFCKLIDRQP